MAKLMAPNIRIDWYPEGHFADPANPTLAELNSGYNLSPAIVTGFTLDFTVSETTAAANIFEEFSHDTITHFSYEARLQFFLAPRRHRIYDFDKTDTENEAAYRKAEELFYHNNHTTGYFVKRFGYKWNVDYSAGQKIDIFLVQSTYPKLSVEDNRPILLEVPFLPLGFAASRAYAGVIRYAWLGEPHNSPSVKMVDGVEVARNLDVNGLPHSLDSWAGTAAAVLEFVEDVGQKAIKVSPEEPRTNAFYVWQPDLDLDSDGWVAVRAEVKALDDWVAERFRVVIQGSNTPQTVHYRPVEKDKFTEITVTMQVQEGTLKRIYWPTNTTSTDKVGFIIRKSRTAMADTEQEALAQVEHYFDGDSIYNG